MNGGATLFAETQAPGKGSACQFLVHVATGVVCEATSIIDDAPQIRGETVLLLGNYRVSIVIARQLGRAGYSVIVGGGTDSVVARCRYVESVWDHPSLFKNSKAFLAALDELLEQRPDISVILPVAEPSLLRLVKLSQQLPIPLAAVDRANVELCCDKGRMVELAAELEVPQAPCAVANNMAELVEVIEQIGYPCVARPNDGRNYEVKAYFIEDHADFLRMFPEWPRGHKSLLVQAHAYGPRYNRYFVADQGVILDSLDVRIVRTDRSDGSGYAVEGVSMAPVPEMDEPSRKLLEHLQYTGVGCVQFLLDERTRQLSFLEINPRIGGNYSFAQRCGLDLVTPLLNLAQDRPLGETAAPGTHDLGKRYQWLYGDLIGLLGSIYKREIGVVEAVSWFFKSGRALVRADAHLTWDRDDPGPTKWFARRLVEAALVILWDLARYVRRRIKSVLRL